MLYPYCPIFLTPEIYQQRPQLLDRVHDRQRRMIAHIQSEFDRHHVQYYMPDGGTVVVVKLPHGCEDDVAYVTALREAHDIQVTAGAFFRMRGHVRLAYMNIAEDAVRDAVTLFAEYYEKRAN